MRWEEGGDGNVFTSLDGGGMRLIEPLKLLRLLRRIGIMLVVPSCLYIEIR